MTREELKKRLEEGLNALGEHPDLENLEEERILEEIQIVKRDSAGYVETVQIGAETYSGDAVRYALGVPSPAFPRGRRGRNPLCYLWARAWLRVVAVRGGTHGGEWEQRGRNFKALF
ncbi:MAG: hypothetical protein ACLR3S_11370 [Clostridium fessum]